MPAISKCTEGRCIFCVRGSLDTDINFYSSCSNKHFAVNFDASCKTCCCIYLITCKCCGLKYVGKTKESIRTRFNGHRGNLCQGSEAFVMLDHFMGKDGHGIQNMIIKPIEMVDNAKLLTKRENYWIGELNTVFPYGLNMDASFGGVKNAYRHVMDNKSGMAIYSLFNVVKSSRKKRGGKNNSTRTGNELAATFNVESWLNDIIGTATLSDNLIHSLRSDIFKLCKANLKLLFLDNAKRIMSGDFVKHPKHLYFHYVIRDLCLFKLQKSYIKPSHAYMIVNHVNKLIDNVNLSRLFGDNYVQSLFPVNNKQFSTPGVSFTYSKSVRSDIVSYKQSIQDPHHEEFECNCQNYSDDFRDNDHGHIYTGDMNIVKHVELRKLLKKGLGYHDQQPPNKDAAYKAVVSGLDTYISKVSPKVSLPVSCFIAWKVEVLKRVKYALDKCKIYKFNNVLSKPSVKSELMKLKEHFVFIPVDKAAKNISIICKKYYIDIMSNEIQNSPTFEAVSDDKVQFVDNLKSQYPKELSNDKLPYLYATAKMHKTPKDFRYITAGRDTAFSDISIAASKCLKLLMNTARTSLAYKIKEIDNCIFIIDNREKVVNFLVNSNQSKDCRKHITTWDFSTLYTKIPHCKLKEKISLFVKKVFECIKHSKKAANFVCCSEKSRTAYYSKTKSKSNASFSCEDLINLINIVIDNSYVIFHGVVYRQVIGIPMGTNCAPFLANIFLHVYEYEYLLKLVQNENVVTARKLAQTFRYQDDCVSLNDDGMFKLHYSNIYPPEMVLKPTNIAKATCTFLDLRISVFRGSFRFKSYDKRNDFDFSIANYPHMDGNIPFRTSYGVYMSQLVRFCDINCEINSFISDVKETTGKFIKQGFIRDMLKSTFWKFRNNYLFKWSKFGAEITDYCGSLFAC